MFSETTTFLEALFAHCPHNSYITFTAIHPSGDKPVPSRHIGMLDKEKQLDTLQRLHAVNEAGWGSYVGIAPRRADLGRWKRGGKRDLVCLPALFIDVDNVDADTLAQIGKMSPTPSCIVASGNGYHFYWLLREPTTNLMLADQIMRQLALHVGGDTQSSVAHSMRLPGTWNTKGNTRLPCRIVHLDSNRRYILDDFEKLVAKPTYEAPPRTEWIGFPTVTMPSAKLRRVLEEVLIGCFGGYRKPNGFIASLCPYPHKCDSAGAHFNYDPRNGTGRCFGKHGQINSNELCQLLGQRIGNFVSPSRISA